MGIGGGIVVTGIVCDAWRPAALHNQTSVRPDGHQAPNHEHQRLDTGSKGTSRVKQDFQRAVAPDQSSVDALKKVGVSVTSQGSVVVDSAKLDAAQKADPAAVRATLTALGRRVDAAASQELDGTGRVGGALASLTQRASELQRQQSALASLAKYGGQS